MTVVGARPQFVKAAAVSRVLRKSFTEILVHTGQHYDKNMSGIFFEELGIPKPDYNLAVGSGSHGKQTAEMMAKLEEIIPKEAPDYVLVFGDTNSTLAATLVAAKLLIPVIHVEAGLRSFNKDMPEEQNRIVADHLSKLLFCPTDAAMENLKRENITDNVYQVGDVMCDAVLNYSKIIEGMDQESFMARLRYLFEWKEPLTSWYLATIHRAENTRSAELIKEALDAFEKLDAPVIFPIHPRIRGFIEGLQEKYQYTNVCFTEPFSYLEMLFFTKNAVKVVTDSGGLQKEAFIMKRNVITLRGETEWVETLEGNHNILCGLKTENILEAIGRKDINAAFNENVYGNGKAVEKICEVLKNFGAH